MYQTIAEYFLFLKDIDPLIGILILVSGMGLVWFNDIEKSPWFLFLFFILLLLFIHFGVAA